MFQEVVFDAFDGIGWAWVLLEAFGFFVTGDSRAEYWRGLGVLIEGCDGCRWDGLVVCWFANFYICLFCGLCDGLGFRAVRVLVPALLAKLGDKKRERHFKVEISSMREGLRV